MNGWTQIAPGYWRNDHPIDQAAATALMAERLAARGYQLHRSQPSLLARLLRAVTR